METQSVPQGQPRESSVPGMGGGSWGTHLFPKATCPLGLTAQDCNFRLLDLFLNVQKTRTHILFQKSLHRIPFFRL